MIKQTPATMSQMWQLVPKLALVLTLPDPPSFERAGIGLER